MTVAPEDAERAVAEACALLGTGCREGATPEGQALIELWVAADGADADGLRAALAEAGVAARVSAHAQDDAWRDALTAYHQPVEVAGRLLVRPPWTAPRPGLLDVVIDPGMAFGTGQHATTRSCLELLVGLADEAPGAAALDAGCGSGVLAIAARRLGLDPVWALDADPLAAAATLANARRNGVGLRVACRAIAPGALPPADVVLANLTGTILRDLAAALPEPGPSALVASGVRPAEAGGVEVAMAARGLRLRRRIDAEGWTTMLLAR